MWTRGLSPFPAQNVVLYDADREHDGSTRRKIQSLFGLASHRLSVMTEHNLSDTVALLSRTPATLNALLRDLPEFWTLRNEGGDTFNAFDVVGHLIHGERTDWMPRARRI